MNDYSTCLPNITIKPYNLKIQLTFPTNKVE